MSFVRTLLGDIDPGTMGITFAHEHLVIDGGRPVELWPDFLLADIDLAVQEVGWARAQGLRTCVDAMPIDAGRNVRKLADISLRSDVHIIGPTGLHLATFYPDDHWSHTVDVDDLADRFRSEIVDGIEGSDHCAGVIKIAASADAMTPREQRVHEAAAHAHVQTGCPILAHCTNGRLALEQVRFLSDRGVDPGHIVLSHTDKVVDRAYHREVLATGACAEFDQAFRWPPGADNGTLTLLAWLIEDGLGAQLMLGNDAARQGYWSAYGGAPGLTFLLGPFASLMDERGLDADARHRLFVSNPARAFAFAGPPGGP